MTDTAPQIRVTLTAEDKGVSAAIKELGNQLSQLKQKQNEVAESSFNLKSAFDAVIASAVVLKIVEFGKEVFKTSLEIDRLAQKTGVSAGFLSTFSKAAETSGVTTEQVTISLGRLATNITKFQQGGNQAAAAFKALNITQADFKNLSPDEKIRLVTDRLGSMHAGLQKAAIAQELMGRGGQALLPTLNALAGEGFDRLTDAAKASGQYLTDDMAANTLAAAAAMNELAGAAKGAATQFEAGLEPAIIEIGEALTDSLASNGAKGFTALGEKAGTVLRYVALLFLDIGTAAGTMVAVVREEFDQMWKRIELGGETVANAIKSGSFKGAWNALAAGGKQAVKDSEEDAGRIRAILEGEGEQLAKNFQQLIPSDDEEKKRQKTRTAKFAPKAGAPDSDPADDKANKARLAALVARLQEELALFKANNAAEESANQIAYNEGLESVRAFYAKKKQLAKDESEQEIATLYAKQIALQKSPTDGTAAAEIAKQQKIAAFQSQIDTAKVTSTQTQKQLDSQLFLAEEAHQKTLQGYQAQILKAQGLTYAAAVAQIQGEAAEVKRNLVQAGLTPDAVAALLAQIQQLRLATAAFDEDKKQGEESLKSLANDKDDINLRVTAGLETQHQAEQDIARLELARIPALEKIAAAMRAAAINPDQIQAADEFARHVKDIQVNATAAANQMQQFGKQAGTAIQGDLNTFLTSTIIQARTVGQAFQALAGSVVGSIQKIVSALLIQIATEKILALYHKLKGVTDTASAAAKGTAQAAPLIAAAAAMTGSGVAITAGATALGISAAALQVAADTLIIANSAGAGAGAAGGGYIRGAGTSTSDSIPARLSDGEFVVRAAAVKAFGVHNLATINQGVTIPPIAGMAIARFAEGGLVQGNSGGAGGDLRLGIGLEEGLILRHLSSKSAGRVILQHLANNPKAATKALSRGQ